MILDLWTTKCLQEWLGNFFHASEPGTIFKGRVELDDQVVKLCAEAAFSSGLRDEMSQIFVNRG